MLIFIDTWKAGSSGIGGAGIWDNMGYIIKIH